MTLGELSTADGPDYDTARQIHHQSGDGQGTPYSLWDKDSMSVCKCDYGYFGPDCSLKMCPQR